MRPGSWCRRTISESFGLPSLRAEIEPNALCAAPIRRGGKLRCPEPSPCLRQANPTVMPPDTHLQFPRFGSHDQSGARHRRTGNRTGRSKGAKITFRALLDQTERVRNVIFVSVLYISCQLRRRESLDRLTPRVTNFHYNVHTCIIETGAGHELHSLVAPGACLGCGYRSCPDRPCSRVIASCDGWRAAKP